MSPSLQTMGFFMSDINFCNTKEQLNHLGEVVTGKVDGSPTGADIDTSTLPYTGQVRKTLPALESEYEQSITDKEAEADAAIDEYRLTNKGPYASGITLESKFEYITYNGESYFAVNPPYTTTATTPDADGNLLAGGYVNESLAAQIAETVLEENISTYAKILYKPQGVESSIANMISGTPIQANEGDVVSTGATTWKIVNTSGLPLSNGLFAIALNGLWMNDFGMVEMNPETGIGDYNDTQVAEAETVALAYGWTKKLNSGWYRLQDDWIMKSSTSGMGSDNTVVVFDSGKGFRNYSGGEKYLIKKINKIRFESDKESKWNATDAGDAYVSGILRWDVRNLYGQRVAKGNKTTTPNNIISNDPQEQQDGDGFWSKDYTQWNQADGVAPDRSALPAVSFSGDENILALSGDRKVITECEFSGFEKNLVISAGFENDINNNVFRTSNYGVVTFNESYTGGSSSNRVTATHIDKNSFYDCDVSHYANDFLQSTFKGNVCQPSIVGMFVGGGGAPQTEVSGNYFEIGHTFFEHFPNLPMRGEVRNNFTNSSSTRYLAWVSNGQLLNFTEPRDQNQKIHFDAGVQTSRIEQGFDLDVNGGFFVDNGNAYSAGVTKEYYIKTTGTGSSFTIDPLSKEFDISLTINPTQSGIVIPNTPKGRLNLINVQMLSGKSIATYFDPQVGDPRDNRSRFFWDTVTDTAIDLRDNGSVKIIKISYTQEPTYVS